MSINSWNSIIYILPVACKNFKDERGFISCHIFKKKSFIEVYLSLLILVNWIVIGFISKQKLIIKSTDWNILNRMNCIKILFQIPLLCVHPSVILSVQKLRNVVVLKRKILLQVFSLSTTFSSFTAPYFLILLKIQFLILVWGLESFILWESFRSNHCLRRELYVFRSRIKKDCF